MKIRRLDKGETVTLKDAGVSFALCLTVVIVGNFLAGLVYGKVGAAAFLVDIAAWLTAPMMRVER